MFGTVLLLRHRLLKLSGHYGADCTTRCACFSGKTKCLNLFSLYLETFCTELDETWPRHTSLLKLHISKVSAKSVHYLWSGESFKKSTFPSPRLTRIFLRVEAGNIKPPYFFQYFQQLTHSRQFIVFGPHGYLKIGITFKISTFLIEDKGMKYSLESKL